MYQNCCHYGLHAGNLGLGKIFAMGGSNFPKIPELSILFYERAI
jgi:hypothetical protein